MKTYKIYLKFIELNLLIQLPILISINLLVGEVLDIIFELINKEDVLKLDFSSYTVFEIVLETVFLAPIIETIIFQFLFIEIFLYLFSKLTIKNKKGIIVFLSGILFGVLHLYNISYMISTAIFGWIYGSIYFFYKVNGKINPFLAVLIIHAFDNLFTLLMDYTL